MNHSNNITQPLVIKGNRHTDMRGTVSFINDFDMAPIKRMYTIQHPDTNIIRAWQGHQIEAKYFKCIQGRFLVAVVAIDDWEDPSKNLQPTTYILDAQNTEILCIPGGYANGFKALDAHAQLIVFSNTDLNTAKGDQFRFDADLWMDWNQPE